MATNIRSIGSGGGRDFSTISAWESSALTQRDLAGDIEIGELYNDADFNEQVTVAGATGQTATSYRHLRPATGQGHTGMAGTGVRNAYGTTLGSNQWVVTLAEDHARFEGIEVTSTVTNTQTSGTNGLIYANGSGTGNHQRILRCIAHRMVTNGAGAMGISLSDGGGGSKTRYCYRNIVYDIDGSGANGNGYTVSSSNSSVGHCYNNTAYGCTSRGFIVEAYGTGTGGVLHCYNNVSAGNGGNDFQFFRGANGVANGSHNASEDATGDDPGATGALINQALASLAFVSTTAGSEDFHIQTGSVLKDAGTNAGAPYDVDIDGAAVSGTWDIGADEFASSNTPVSSSESTPIESVQLLSPTAQTAVESITPVNLATAANVETLAPALLTTATEVEAAGNAAGQVTSEVESAASVISDVPSSIESIAQANATASVAVEAVQPTESSAITVSEATAPAQATAPAVIEALHGFSASTPTPVEAEGQPLIPVSNSEATAVESVGGAVQLVDTPAEALTAVSLEQLTAAEWIAHSESSAAASVESVLPLLVITASPIESALGIAVAETTPIEAEGTPPSASPRNRLNARDAVTSLKAAPAVRSLRA